MDRRYQKRLSAYWKREKRKAIKSLECLDFSTWFDLWHTHPDWKSKGNRFPEIREMVAKITYELLCYAESLAQTRSEPIQLFASFCEDTGNNAVYIHSENPNGTTFPYEFYNADWDVPPPVQLVGIVDDSIHVIGREKFSDEVVYIIRKREIS